jgi:hypothetical protein
MQNERVDIGTKLSHEEGHPLGHESRNEMYVTAQAIKLGDSNWAAEVLSLREGHC